MKERNVSMRAKAVQSEQNRQAIYGKYFSRSTPFQDVSRFWT
ncbi:MAG TPA: hypothetical protein P5560_05000 [Thermotogota bacterium]|nr:hypothetical protein [Thermotogota bacterium]HRW92294.1 hypothetical protein [Thermotogota bacterium]